MSFGKKLAAVVFLIVVGLIFVYVKNTRTPVDGQKVENIESIGITDISHAFDQDKLLIRSGDTIYMDIHDDPKSISFRKYPNAASLTWVKHPIVFSNNQQVKTALFDAQALPNDQGIILVLSHLSTLSQNPVTEVSNRSIYLLSLAGTTTQDFFPLLTYYSNSNNREYSYPRIAYMSADGSMVAFNMYNCWDCQPVHPQTLVVKLHTEPAQALRTLNVGEITDFSFHAGNSFSYRQFPMECYDSYAPGEIEKLNACVELNMKRLLTNSLE